MSIRDNELRLAAAPAGMLTCWCLLRRAPSEPAQTGLQPSVQDSEVYKMLQENQESDEPPRQSASFKVLQEILETGNGWPQFIYLFILIK